MDSFETIQSLLKNLRQDIKLAKSDEDVDRMFENTKIAILIASVSHANANIDVIKTALVPVEIPL